MRSRRPGGRRRGRPEIPRISIRAAFPALFFDINSNDKGITDLEVALGTETTTNPSWIMRLPMPKKEVRLRAREASARQRRGSTIWDPDVIPDLHLSIRYRH